MDWVLIVLASAAVHGLVSISDKAEHRFGTSPLTVPLMIGLAQVPSGIAILSIVGVPSDIDSILIIYAVVSGVLFSMGALIWQQILLDILIGYVHP